MDTTKVSIRLTRRQLLALGGQTAALAFLAGCGATPTAAPQPTKAPGAPTAAPTKPPAPAPSTIEFLAWGDTTDGPAWEKLKPAYEAKNAGQVINLTPVADPNNNFYTKLQTMFAGGTTPDLISFQGWEWQVYADKNLLAPIDDFITRDKLTAPYPEGYTSVEQSVKRKGKTYLVPLQMGVMVMFYAKKIFDDAGVKYPTDDWTFDQFVELAKKLTDAGQEEVRLPGQRQLVPRHRLDRPHRQARVRQHHRPEKVPVRQPRRRQDDADRGLRPAARRQGRSEPHRHVGRQHHQHRRLRHEVRGRLVPAAAQYPAAPGTEEGSGLRRGPHAQGRRRRPAAPRLGRGSLPRQDQPRPRRHGASPPSW